MIGRRRRLKRRLLSELVEENLDQIRGGPPRRQKRRLPPSLRLLAVALLPLSLFAPSHSAPPPSVAPLAAQASPAAGSGEVDHGLHPAGPYSGLPFVAAPRPNPLQSPAAPVPGADPRRRAAAAGDGLLFTDPVEVGPVDPAVFPLEVRRVVIDPGHGGENGGTRTPSGVVEKDLVLDISLRLAELLEEAGFEVLLTRTEDVAVSLEERAAFANREQADLFVSIHLNWIETREVRGVETYYLGTTDDPFITRLAAAENRDPGYSQADLRELLDELYAGLRQDSSEKAAGAIQRSLLRSLRTVNPAVEDRGVKTAPFIVLMKTGMPAVLAEVSCLSNQKEAELLTRPLYRQYIAEALRDGIRSYAEAVREPEPGGRVTASAPERKAVGDSDSKGTRS